MTKLYSHLVWLGAGQAKEPANLLSLADQATLIDAREMACQALKKMFPQSNVTVLQAALTICDTPIEFTEYNLAEFSAIQPAKELKKIFPGLKTTKKTTAQGEKVVDVISALSLEEASNVLVVDIADSNLPLLESLGALLNKFSEIYIQTANEQLYENAFTTIEITSFLQEQGYILQKTINTDPDLPWLNFGINPLWVTLQQTQQEAITNKQNLEKTKIETESLRQALADKEANTNNCNAALAAANKAKQEIEKQLEQIQQQLESSVNEHSKLSQHSTQKDAEIKSLHNELAEANKKLDAAGNDLTNAVQKSEQQIEILQAILKERNEQIERFSKLEAKISGFAENITGHFDKQLHRTSQKIQSNINLQSHMQHGSLPVFTDSTFSSELALYLAERLDINTYDLVIEFGGGRSTAFIARTLQKHISRDNDNNHRLGYNNASGSKDVTLVAADEFDLPKRIVTLEHRKPECEKISAILASNHLEALVHLVHAPLVDYSYCGSNYLFYDCEDSLRQISKVYEGRSAKILVLVSGPPVKAGIGAKVPALPALLNVLGRHNIDLLLCAHDGNQTAIIEQWSELLDQRGIQYKKEAINSLQSCALVSIENK